MPDYLTEAHALAYCAGVIDSDGSISVRRTPVRLDSTQPTYSERVKVKQVEPQAVELLHTLFGGTRRYERASIPKGKPLHSWEVTDLRAAECLASVLPYLRIKRRQAENALALRAVKEHSKRHRIRPGRGHAGGAKRSPDHSQQMEALFVRSKELNRVGIP